MSQCQARSIKGAAKVHVCNDCLKAINVGEPYERVRVFDARDAHVWRSCARCVEYAKANPFGVPDDRFEGWMIYEVQGGC